MAGLLTDLDIVNAACAAIGEAPLQSLDEEIDAGQSAALLYNAVLEFNLDIYKFSFAKQIRQLSKNALGQALAGYTTVFDMPAERIGNPLYVTDDPTDNARRFSEYAIVGAQIHASVSPLYAMILFRAPVYNWSGAFKMMTITALAANFAIPMCHDRALAEEKKQAAYGTPSDDFRGGMMRAAINADSFTNPGRTQDRDNNPLTNSWRSQG
jgi:hypothetical protein